MIIDGVLERVKGYIGESIMLGLTCGSSNGRKRAEVVIESAIKCVPVMVCSADNTVNMLNIRRLYMIIVHTNLRKIV